MKQVQRMPFLAVALIALVAGLGTPALAQDAGTPDAEALAKAYPERPYSPYAGGAVPTRVFWGDTHLHTSYSMDAGAFGAGLVALAARHAVEVERLVVDSGEQAAVAGVTLARAHVAGPIAENKQVLSAAIVETGGREGVMVVDLAKAEGATPDEIQDQAVVSVCVIHKSALSAEMPGSIFPIV